jgi:hypothetical protein
VATNNPTLLERVIDKEVFEKVYKGVRTQLSAFEVRRLAGEGEVAELELQGRIREVARQMMKQMRFTEEDDEGEEEIKNDTA